MTREEAINNSITSVTMSPLLTRKEKLELTMILANIQDDLEKHGLLESEGE